MKSIVIYTLLFFAALLIFGCKGSSGNQNTEKKEGLQPEDVIGVWQTKKAEIHIRTAEGKKNDTTIVIDAAANSAKQNYQPPQTTILHTGAYREEIISLSDSLISIKKGFWHIYNDTLFFRPEGKGEAPSHYFTQRKGNALSFFSMLDWDGDGQKDDEISVVLKLK